MAKKKCSPDRRGMGAQSDFIAQQFVPSEEFKTRQLAMVQTLLATGVNPEQLKDMFLFPVDLLTVEKPTNM
jgi:hypothetical protein